MFEGPNLPSTVNGVIPTFGVNPSNTNFLAATGVFTNKKEGICTFPKSYAGNSDGENTITPYVMGNFVTRGVTSRATLKCKGLNGAKTYTSFQCPQITYNRMAEGEFTLYFAAPTGPQFSPYVFAVSSPTTATDYVYETAIASTTLAPAPATTNFITQTSGTETVTITISPQPSTTITETAFSVISPHTIFETPAEQTHVVFESLYSTSTFLLPGEPLSTTTETEYTSTAVTTEYSTATIITAATATEYVESCSSAGSSTSSETVSSSSTSATPSTSSSNLLSTESSTIDTTTSHTDSTLTSTAITTSTSLISTETVTSTDASPSPTDSTSIGTSTHSTETVTSTGTSNSAIHTGPTPPACPESDGSFVSLANGACFSVKCHKDYQAGQLGAEYTKSFEGCMQACSKSSGCKAVAYTGGSSAGWCYLKSQYRDAVDIEAVWGAVLTTEATQNTETTESSTSSTSTVASATSTLSCPASDKESFKTKDGSSYTVECYADHFAGDIGMTYKSTLDSCIEACASRGDCVDIAWLPGSPGPCYLKGEVGARLSNQGVWGAIKATSSTPSASTSSDTATTTPTSASVCPGGMLSPTTTINCPVHNGACFKTTSQDVFQIECFSDRYAGDLALSWETTFLACLEKCASTPNCIDVSYAHGAGACYMKNAANAIVHNRDIYGARKVEFVFAPTTFTKRWDAYPTTLLAQRAAKTDPADFDYTYPWTFRTTVTRTAATRLVTVTPAPAGTTTSTIVTQAVQTVTLTPQPSGAATYTLTTATASALTETLQAAVKTVTEVAYSTAVETVAGGPGGVATRTVRTVSMETRWETTVVTVVGSTQTVWETGCRSAARPTVTVE